MIGLDLFIPRAFFRYFRYFRGYAGPQVYLLIVLAAISGWAEGIGIALLFPLFTHGGSGGNDFVSHALAAIFRFLHLQMTPAAALPAVVLLFCIKGVLNFFTTNLQFFLSAQTTRRLRDRLVRALGDAEYRYVLSTNSGYLTNLLVNEVPRATSGFLYLTRVWVPLINILVFFGIILTLDWQLTLIVSAMGVVMLALLRFPSRVGKRYSVLLTAESGVLAGLLIPCVQAFKYLVTTAGFARFRPRIERSTETLAHAEHRSGTVLGVTSSLIQPVMVLFLAGILYYRLIIRKEDLAPLVVLLMYLFRIMAEVFALQTSWQVFVSLMGSVDAVWSALPTIEAQREVVGSELIGEIRQGWTCNNVSFRYSPDKPPVLRDVSLTIARHSTVAFVGESGSGKTTLVDLLTGTLRPSSGTVAVDGIDLLRVDLRALRKRIGYVPQDCPIFEDTVANNISLWSGGATEAQVRGRIRQAAALAQCLDFIDAMPAGLDSAIGERGVTLSGGQRQRLAIARELFKEPDILILDEATSALDSESETALQASIDALKGRMTILIVAHRLSTIRNCDYVFVLSDGQLLEQGAPSALVSRPDSAFRRLWDLQGLSATGA
jgi:subfamily B ATP-binding cassette protein MsbA